MAHEDDEPESDETALWRRTVETLLARGSSPAEAIEGANLVLQSYQRHRHTQAPKPESKPPEDTRGTGVRLRKR